MKTTGTAAAGEVSDTITISDDDTVDSMSVAVNITHPDKSQLTIKLESPDGTEVTLRDQTGTGANISANFTPSDFDAESTDGTWTLTVIDNDTGDSGTLDDWSLTMNETTTTTTSTTTTDAGEITNEVQDINLRLPEFVRSSQTVTLLLSELAEMEDAYFGIDPEDGAYLRPRGQQDSAFLITTDAEDPGLFTKNWNQNKIMFASKCPVEIRRLWA